MSMVEIPLASNGPYFSQENQLFGHSYNFEFEWIEREEFWAMHIYDESELPIALGIRLMVNWPLFVHRQSESSTGLLLISKTPNAQLKLDNLQSDFTLVAYAAV